MVRYTLRDYLLWLHLWQGHHHPVVKRASSFVDLRQVLQTLKGHFGWHISLLLISNNWNFWRQCWAYIYTEIIESVSNGAAISCNFINIYIHFPADSVLLLCFITCFIIKQVFSNYVYLQLLFLDISCLLLSVEYEAYTYILIQCYTTSCGIFCSASV